MNDAVFIGFAGLGLAVVLHVIFVSMTLGSQALLCTAIIIPV